MAIENPIGSRVRFITTKTKAELAELYTAGVRGILAIPTDDTSQIYYDNTELGGHDVAALTTLVNTKRGSMRYTMWDEAELTFSPEDIFPVDKNDNTLMCTEGITSLTLLELDSAHKIYDYEIRLTVSNTGMTVAMPQEYKYTGQDPATLSSSTYNGKDIVIRIHDNVYSFDLIKSN